MSKREDLTLCSYKNNNNNKRIKRQEETFGGDGYVYNIDCFDRCIYTYLQMQQVVYIKYVQLLCMSTISQ